VPARDQEVSLGTVRDGVYNIGVSLDLPNLSPLGRVPLPDGLVCGPGRDLFPVGRPCDGVDLEGVTVQRLHCSGAAQPEELDRLVTGRDKHGGWLVEKYHRLDRTAPTCQDLSL